MKIGIHLHLYYLDQWEFFKVKLEYIDGKHGYDKILIITTSKGKKEEVRKLIKMYPCHIFELENRGYDVAPFIFALNKFKKWSPNLVLKIQTKGNKNRKGKIAINNLIYKNALEWRTRQVKSLLGSKKNTKNIIKTFKNKEVGILGAYETIYPFTIHGHKKVEFKKYEKFYNIFKEVGIKERNKPFFAGTMFWLNWKVAEYLISKLKFEDFDFVNKKTFGTTKECDTIAHAFEHSINSIVDFLSLKIKSIDNNFKNKIYIYYRKKIKYRFFNIDIEKGFSFKLFNIELIKIKITNKNKLLIKVLKVPVFSKKLKDNN